MLCYIRFKIRKIHHEVQKKMDEKKKKRKSHTRAHTMSYFIYWPLIWTCTQTYACHTPIHVHHVKLSRMKRGRKTKRKKKTQQNDNNNEEKNNNILLRVLNPVRHGSVHFDSNVLSFFLRFLWACVHVFFFSLFLSVHVLCIGCKLLIAFDLLLISVCMRQSRAKISAKIHYSFGWHCTMSVKEAKRTGESTMECIVLVHFVAMRISSLSILATTARVLTQFTIT